MKKNLTIYKLLSCIGITSLILGAAAINVFANENKSMPETINLNIQTNHAEISGLPEDKKSVNNFTHRKHAEEYLPGNSAYAENTFEDSFTCAACHAGTANAEEITGVIAQERLLASLNKSGGPKKLKNYFHGICLNCHKSMKKANMHTGPTKCNDCHSRK